jgi:hypothetical protein
VLEALRLGACDYLAKPIRVQLLFGMLQRHLGVRFVAESPQPAAHARAGVVEPDRRRDIGVRLQSAITMGDIGAIQALGERLSGGTPAEVALGEQIGRLARDFDFDGLGELADSLTA